MVTCNLLFVDTITHCHPLFVLINYVYAIDIRFVYCIYDFAHDGRGNNHVGYTIVAQDSLSKPHLVQYKNNQWI